MSDKQVVLAAIAGAHGIGGEVRLKLFSESLEGLKRHKRLFAGDRSFSLVSLRGGKDGAIARLDGVDDRNAAEALRGQLLSVPRSELPPLGEGEYYHVDLIGLPCVDQAGQPIGTVVAVENFGAGDLVEIETAAAKRSLVPLRMGIADLVGGRIVVDPVFLA